jgi:hypothetical protein
MENSLPLLQSALDIAQAAIKRLIIQDILKYQHHHRQNYQSHKNCKITYWILFHRYLVNYEQLKALKDKEKAENSSQGKGGMRDEDDDGGNDGFNDDINPMSFHTAGDSKSNKKGEDPSKSTDKKKEAELFNFQNISELILYYRDEIIYSSLPTDIPLTRYLMKLLSLQMITMVLQEFLINPLTKGISCHPTGGESGGNDELVGGSEGENVLQSFQFHSNLIQAREKLKQLLSTGATSSSTTTLVPGKGDQSKRRSFQYQELVELPFSLSFFLNDLMTLACMMSTHTMNDKNIYFLQGKGMDLLHQVIVLFLQTQDPDVISTSTSASEEVNNPGSVENKILTQFLSQILGAIRHSFTLPTYFTPIHSSSQHLLVLLIKNGFQSDKVAIKRLWKCILGYLEEHMNAKEFPAEAGGMKLFRKRMNEMNELFSLHNFLVFYKVLLNYLHLFQEGNGTNSNSELKSLLFNGDAGLSSTSVSSSPPLSAGVVGLLQECFIQSSYSGMVVPFTSLLIQDTLKLLSFPLMKHSFLLSGLPVENEDENDIDEWNPLRGGEIYSYHVNIFGLQDSLIEATFQSVNYLLLSSLTSSSAVSAKKNNNNKAVVLPEKFLDQVMMLISLYLRHCLMVSSPSSVAVTTVGQRMMKLLPYTPTRLFSGGENYYCFLNSFPLVLDTLVLLMMQSSPSSTSSSPTKTAVATEEEHWMDCLSHLMQLLTSNQEDENPNSDDTHCLLKFSSVRKKVFYLFYSFLQRHHVREGAQETKESQDSVKSLFQWFFQLLKNYSFPQFFLHRHSHDFDYELIDIFSTFRKVLSVMNNHDNVDEEEYYYILLTFQSFYSLQTSDTQLSMSASVSKVSYLRTLYLLLGVTMTVSLPASSSKRKEQILKLFLDFYENNVLASNGETTDMIEEDIRFLGLFLWNSFISVGHAKSSSSSSPPVVALSENRFITVLDVVLSLLSQACDRLSVLTTTNETEGEEEEGKAVDKMTKLNEIKVFLSEIFSATLLKMEMVSQSSPLLFRMTVQYFCSFFQRQQQQSQSQLGMRSFSFQMIEMVLPAVLHSILPITNKNNNNKNINKNTPLVTDHESRLAIHKLIVLVFHVVIQFYNNSNSGDSTAVEAVEKSQMMERLLSLVIPVYCQHISCYYPAAATSTGNNNSENQTYLVVMGKCLMNIVSLVSQEFRTYLLSPNSGIAEESKQSLQYVMKLSMTS